MSNRADIDSVTRFHNDRQFLQYNNTYIASAMGMDRSNYSSYVNGHLPITKGFLHRFYKIFDPEIQSVKRERERCRDIRKNISN